MVILVQCRSRDAELRDQLEKDVKATATRAAAIDGRVLLVPPHSLPMTSSGKLSRARAKQNYLEGLYSEVDETAGHGGRRLMPWPPSRSPVPAGSSAGG